MRHLFVAATFGFAFCAFASVNAQETTDEPAFQSRLPTHFPDIVTEAQRKQIYDIQKKFFQQIRPLQKQIAELEKQERKEIEGVLTDEQRVELGKLIEDARQRRDLTRNLTAAQRRAAQEAARKAFLEAVRKAQESDAPKDGETPPDGK